MNLSIDNRGTLYLEDEDDKGDKKNETETDRTKNGSENYVTQII